MLPYETPPREEPQWYRPQSKLALLGPWIMLLIAILRIIYVKMQ